MKVLEDKGLNESAKVNESVIRIDGFDYSDIDQVDAVAYMYGVGNKEAREGIENGTYTIDEVKKACLYKFVVCDQPMKLSPSERKKMLKDLCKKNGIKLLKESVTVNESNNEITLKSKDGSEIIINSDGGTYFYTSRGQANKYVAREVYKALYPKKVIGYVDSSSGFIDFKISSDKIAKMILELPVTSSYKRK